MTDPVGFSDVVTAGIKPETCVAMSFAVPLAVPQHSFQNVGDGAVVSPAIACRQNDDISIPWFAGITIPAVTIVWDIPVPLWLRFEIARLWSVVVRCDSYYSFPWCVVPVVVDWDVSKESE